MFPPAINHPHEIELAVEAARMVARYCNVQFDKEPLMEAEDFIVTRSDGSATSC